MLSIYDQALKYLNLKMHSRRDLATKLKRKGFSDVEIEETLTQLEHEGLINDTVYAENFLRNLIEYRTFGYYGIRAKLLLKQLDKQLVDGLLSRSLSEKIELNIAKRFLDRTANKDRERNSLIQAMRQKGYRSSVIIKAIALIPDEDSLDFIEE